MWPFASVCRYCRVHIYGGSIQLRGPLYSHISIYLNFEVYMEFITIYGNVFGYIQRALLLMFYMWTLDLLYHTLHAAMKSEELTKALSKPFIPSVASILFPCHIKRVQKAVSAYFEKASLSACSDLRTLTNIYLYVDSLICRVWKQFPTSEKSLR